MVDPSHKYILITGLMGSGKSTLIREFILENEVEEFTRPPVEAKFRGMEFEFIDQIFALKKDNIFYNFYELDAPTINKWTQFVKVANAIVIVYNYQKSDYFESPKKFIENLKSNSTKNTPFIFVANNCDDSLKEAKQLLEKHFNLSSIKNHKLEIVLIRPGEMYFSEDYGRRIDIDKNSLKSLYQLAVKRIEEIIDD